MMLFYFQDKQSVMERISLLNWRLIYLILSIASIGFLMLYSADGGSFQPWLFKQVVYFTIFFPVMLLIAIMDIRFFLKTSYFYYIFVLILIIAVDIMGHNAMGATRWFKIGGLALQPSEIMKVCLVLAMAKYFNNITMEEIENIKYSIIPVVMIMLPVIFVFDQPDLGTATIILMVGVSVLFIAGIKSWKFLTVGILTLISIPFIWIFVLYDYQKQRILNFINPNNDPLGSGYNIIQSKIAIGSGGFFGKGYLQGTQGQLEFLPEKQTDFIFTMLSEEFGFFGSASTIFLYSLIIYYGNKIAFKSQHQFGRILAFGITNILFIHIFINMGMGMGLLPVVGAPLPLISYGGTITASMLIGFGLLLNIDKNSDLEDIKI